MAGISSTAPLAPFSFAIILVWSAMFSLASKPENCRRRSYSDSDFQRSQKHLFRSTIWNVENVTGAHGNVFGFPPNHFLQVHHHFGLLPQRILANEHSAAHACGAAHSTRK